MNNEDCKCPACQAFEEGFDLGYKEGYKRALINDVEMKIEIIEDIENEDECTCCDCGECQ